MESIETRHPQYISYFTYKFISKEIKMILDVWRLSWRFWLAIGIILKSTVTGMRLSAEDGV